MSEESFTAIIQMVGLFLPAWAIMIQILARLMERADVSETPAMIPFFGVGLSLAIVSFWLFGRAVVTTIFSYALNEIESLDPLVMQSLLDIMQAELAFTVLGLIVLTLAGMQYFDPLDGLHIVIIAALSITIMSLEGSMGENRPARIAWLLIFLIILDAVVCIFAWANTKQCLQDGWGDVRDRIPAQQR